MAKPDKTVLHDDLRSLIAEIAELEPAKITIESNFIDDLGMDSMMALEILAAIEKKYGIKISEDNLPKMTSLKQIIEIVERLMGDE